MKQRTNVLDLVLALDQIKLNVGVLLCVAP